jgi:hypothetical protein
VSAVIVVVVASDDGVGADSVNAQSVISNNDDDTVNALILSVLVALSLFSQKKNVLAKILLFSQGNLLLLLLLLSLFTKELPRPTVVA